MGLFGWGRKKDEESSKIQKVDLKAVGAIKKENENKKITSQINKEYNSISEDDKAVVNELTAGFVFVEDDVLEKTGNGEMLIVDGREDDTIDSELNDEENRLNAKAERVSKLQAEIAALTLELQEHPEYVGTKYTLDELASIVGVFEQKLSKEEEDV